MFTQSIFEKKSVYATFTHISFEKKSLLRHVSVSVYWCVNVACTDYVYEFRCMDQTLYMINQTNCKYHLAISIIVYILCKWKDLSTCVYDYALIPSLMMFRWIFMNNSISTKGHFRVQCSQNQSPISLTLYNF